MNTNTHNRVDFWNRTSYPTLEITTNVAKSGCVVDCAFCPQRTLERVEYIGDRILSMDNFKKVIDKLPKEIRITFAGFTEPWLNKYCTDMLLYAYNAGHPVAAFTTAVGMSPEDVYKIKDIKFTDGPNGGFALHLPDQQRVAKHPITKTYIKTIEAFQECEKDFNHFYTVCMGNDVHESVRHAYQYAQIPPFYSRAGNLLGEGTYKKEVKLLNFIKTPIADGPRTCGCVEDLYHNVLLPNGNVSLCCQDYSLEHILGNLFTQPYEEVIPKPNTCFSLCRACENQKIPDTDLPTAEISSTKLIPRHFNWGDLGIRSSVNMDNVGRRVFIDKAYTKHFDVNDGDVVVDVGASVGPFSYSILNKKPSKIICIEPNRQLFHTLMFNMSNADIDINLINAAIADRDEDVEIHGTFDPKGTTSLAKGIRFDTLIKNYQLEKIDFLKFSCTGGEYSIFSASNFNWIASNVKKIAGRFYLKYEDEKRKFKEFRDMYISVMPVYHTTIDIFDNSSIERESYIDIYIDNRNN